ncbi:marginal zone B- and B1-cell-specific protein isoform X1 [Octodon degus]|uniref:Marginal zone B- and B1-cell-specific protein isoform X1 n=1 Tax=Octodon degus TaxID=10160 RepID=A0A6P6DGQ1_OCTDE|nr:marginal zone B- and B1-cell-specific protein isoform X1 [Octodon degus]
MRLSLLLLLGAWAVPEGLGDQGFLSATAPQLDEEEKYSAHMPTHLRCDACRAIAYQPRKVDPASVDLASALGTWAQVLQPVSQIWQHLAKAEAKLHASDSRGQQELSESEYTDVLDRSCSQNWKNYGVREVNQMKRLIGPGLSEGSEPSISVMVTGGPWPNRLSRMCLQYLGDFGEDEIYEAHQQGREAVEALLCGDTQGPCSAEASIMREEL